MTLDEVIVCEAQREDSAQDEEMEEQLHDSRLLMLM